MKHRLNQSSGFTLLELLMVVIIVGILAALALPGYIRSVERARTAEATTTLGQIRGAIQRYCVENGGPPADLTVLDVDNPNNLPVRRFDYAIIASTCPPLFSMTLTATRGGTETGPCDGSTVVLTEPPPPGGSAFTYTWLGSCT